MAYTKFLISGTIHLNTGLHIGGDDSYSAIGALDLPVIRDVLTRNPIIPGSTLKGKMRTMLAREMGSKPAPKAQGFKNDRDEIKRLFGSGSDDLSNAAGTGIQMSRLQFSDCFLSNSKKLPKQIVETKFENTIDRLTSMANPRQVERVIRGAEFRLEIIYNVEDPDNPDEVFTDFRNIDQALDLLTKDYIGGGGTRGNGRIVFLDMKVAKITKEEWGAKQPELKDHYGEIWTEV